MSRECKHYLLRKLAEAALLLILLGLLVFAGSAVRDASMPVSKAAPVVAPSEIDELSANLDELNRLLAEAATALPEDGV
jgi:hypothetical protein